MQVCYVCYDKAQISIQPVVLHNRDEVGYMNVIMGRPVPSTLTSLKAMMLDLHQTMQVLNTIHFVTDCPKFSIPKYDGVRRVK